MKNLYDNLWRNLHINLWSNHNRNLYDNINVNLRDNLWRTLNVNPNVNLWDSLRGPLYDSLLTARSSTTYAGTSVSSSASPPPFGAGSS